MTVTPVLATQKQLDRARGGSVAAPRPPGSSPELAAGPYDWGAGGVSGMGAGPLEPADPLAIPPEVRGASIAVVSSASAPEGLQQGVADMAEDIAVVCLVSGLCVGSLLSWLWLLAY